MRLHVISMTVWPCLYCMVLDSRLYLRLACWWDSGATRNVCTLNTDRQTSRCTLSTRPLPDCSGEFRWSRNFWRHVASGRLDVFTALHWMQGGLVVRKASVCLSVKNVDCDKTEEKYVHIFTVLHWMQARSSDENSVRLSVTRVNCDKPVERYPDLYTIRKIT